MSEEAEDRFIRPIVNASFPGTLAGLSLTVFGIIDIGGTPPLPIRAALLLGAGAFLFLAFCIFFYGIYLTRNKFWSVSALCFLVGLFSSVAAVVLLIFMPAHAGIG